LKRVLISIFAIVFAFSAVAMAGDGCSEAAKKACGAAKAKSGCCAAKAKTATAQKISADNTEEMVKVDHACPDVGDRAALQGFHESMHPLHMALSEQNYDAVREGLPSLLKASKAVDKFKCEGYENCPKDLRKAFDRNKKELLNAVNSLKKACKDKDNEKVTASFDKMHEAYITFANTCSH
jgi:hypothetical protein